MTLKKLKEQQSELSVIMNKNMISKILDVVFCFISFMMLACLIYNAFTLLPDNGFSFVFLCFGVSFLWIVFTLIMALFSNKNSMNIQLNKEQMDKFYPILKEILGNKNIIRFLNNKNIPIEFSSRTGNAYLVSKLYQLAISIESKKYDKELDKNNKEAMKIQLESIK